MADTTFVNGTVIEAEWLNDVNDFVYSRNSPYGVEVLADLNTVTLANGSYVQVEGRTTANDGGGGLFVYYSASAAVVDDGVIFTSGSGKLIRDGWTPTGFSGVINPRWYGAVFDGTTNDSAAVQACLTAAAGFGNGSKVAFYTGTTKLNTAISHNSKVEVDLGEAILDFSGCVSFAAWTIGAGKDIRRIKNVLTGGTLLGVATPGDGVYSATTVGIQFSTSQLSISNVLIKGFIAAFYYSEDAYVIAINDCSAWYNGRGVDADQTARSNMGADLKFYSCLFAHNDYDVYNVLCELTFYACAFDQIQKSFVENNTTASGGANNGYLGFQNCRFEGGGNAAFPLFTNSGYMIFKEPKFYEVTAYTYVFENSGRIDIDGGLSRIYGNTYTSVNTGAGTISFYGCRPVDFNGTCFRLSAAESGIQNGDFETGTTDGWEVTTGSGTDMTCVTTTPHSGTYCLQLVSGGATFVAKSVAIPIRAGCRQALANLMMKNLNATEVKPLLKFYSVAAVELGSEEQTLPANTTAWTQVRFVGTVPRGTAYAKLVVPLAIAQTLAVRLDDIYFNFA